MRRVVVEVVVLGCLFGSIAAYAQPNDLGRYAIWGGTSVKIGDGASLNGGAVGSNGSVLMRGGTIVGPVAADQLKFSSSVVIQGSAYFNAWNSKGTIGGPTHNPVALPIVPPPAPIGISPGTTDVDVPAGAVQTIPAGNYGSITIHAGAQVTLEIAMEVDSFVMRGGGVPTAVNCSIADGCAVFAKSKLIVDGDVGASGGPISFVQEGSSTIVIGRRGATINGSVYAPAAKIKLRSSKSAPTTFTGALYGDRVVIGKGAVVQGTITGAICGDLTVTFPEQCDLPDDSQCPGQCLPNCACPYVEPLVLHSIGPSLLNNATDFGVQIFGSGFLPGAQLELSDKTTTAVIEVLPTTFISSTELTALVPAGMPVPSGIQRELVARIINPDAVKSDPPDIGHCQIDNVNSRTACHSAQPCGAGIGVCVTGDQRLTMFNDAVFLNPNSAVVAPDPFGVCDDGTPCQSAGTCAGIGGGACSAKLYVTPQQRDELWVYNTGTRQFVDKSGTAGIQGIPVGDNPFHVELLTAGGNPRAWVVNRFADSFSIIDPATDTEVTRVTGTALGMPGRLRMNTEIEFNRAGTRAYLSNQNLDEVLVFDIAGANRDAPLFVGTIDVGVNPRGMATNTADTRLYVANIQSADISVVDIAPGSPTENQVVDSIETRATDDIVGGRADGWEGFVISGRAPRGIIFSDDLQALFVTSIGPQTGPRPGVNQVGGAIINPTITVIDAASDAIVAHVALNGMDPDRFKCTDPELMALDDARGRLYVTCQGSGTLDIIDTASLVAAGAPELRIMALPLPGDAAVPTLAINPTLGPLGGKVCGAMTGNPGTGCLTDAQCFSCPTSREGLPVECCSTNNPIGLHNGPRGIALNGDASALYVINQFTTSITSLATDTPDPNLVHVTGTTSFPGAFGSNTEQRDRRLGQIEFSTDVKSTNTSCATCHIDDHQDGVFFEADVAGPRLRRVLSVRGTRDFPPLLQDQLVPDLVAFTDVVVHVERFGSVCQPCTELNGVFTCLGATCNLTTNTENQQNTLYAKAVTFFPNPNLNADGSLSATVPLPGGQIGDAVHGEALFDQLACASCHPEPMFTIDQFRVFVPQGLGIQPVRMRDVQTPVLLPLRERCQNGTRPAGVDGTAGFSTPTLRGIWDTFPLLMSGSAGLEVVGTEPVFGSCVNGSSGCCTLLQSPITPDGAPVPEQHLEVSTKDALRAALTAPLAVPSTGHGAALGLDPQDLNDLIAYLRSL